MFSIFQHFGPEIPFTLILLALMGLRRRVTPKTSLWINTTPAKLWALIDVYDGKTENWGRTTIRSDLVDIATQTYRKTYTTTQPNGIVRPFSALFRINRREPEQCIELERSGIDGKPENNELLKLSHSLVAEKNGTRLTTVYHWGSRPLIAQLLARTDLWSGAWRLKGQAETGVPNERPFTLISFGVAIVTGLLTLGGFILMLGLPLALLLIVVLFVHEFGHLLAFRLLGQPWGRLVFLPFLGAMAMPRLGFESQAQAVFSALMGPGFSILLTFFCAAPWILDYQAHPFLGGLGIITALLNIFNMLPAEPLDGGIALRSVLTRLMGHYAQYGLIAVGVLIASLGFAIDQIILVVFGGLAIIANLKVRKIDAGLKSLSTVQVWICAFGYAAIIAAHFALLQYLLVHGATLQS
jgi:Zn-dependent protease